MKKILFKSFFLVLTVFAFSNASAQLSVNGNLGMLQIEDAEDAQLGVNVAVKYAINDNINVGAYAGYYTKSYEGDISFSTMPIGGLFEYSFSDAEFSPYAGANVGIYRIAFDALGITASESNLGFAPVIGANYSLSNNLSINLNGKYHYITTDVEGADPATALSINLGVSIDL